MMTEGWLWTGQYPECKRILTKGNNQSMELDPDTLNASWSKDGNVVDLGDYGISFSGYNALNTGDTLTIPQQFPAFLMKIWHSLLLHINLFQ